MDNVVPLNVVEAKRQRRKQQAEAAKAAVVEDSLAWCIHNVRFADLRAKSYIVDYMLKVLLYERANPPAKGLPYRPKP